MGAEAALPVEEALEAYALLAQELLQAQLAALTGVLGVSPLVADCARQLWFALLPGTGLLQPDFAK